MLDPMMFNSLRRFRAGVYGAFGARRDALFDLLDAATVAGLVPSLAYLSLTAVHRRGWGSRYDALATGTLEVPALRGWVARWPLDQDVVLRAGLAAVGRVGLGLRPPFSARRLAESRLARLQ